MTMTAQFMFKWQRILALLTFFVCTLVSVSCEEHKDASMSMYEPVDEIARLGPSHFPKPSHLYHDDSVVPVAHPIIGEHRPNVHAVFAYAEGYVLGHYILFLQTLRETGFDGDVVLAIADDPPDDVVDYLVSQSHVVVYKASLDCFDPNHITRAPRRIKDKSPDPFQMCQLKNVYANSTTTQPDARAGRVVATLRYEWYWIWSLQYNPQQWILLLDARDSIFQLDPLPTTLPTTTDRKSLLYFFGENAKATRLGNSRKNANWLRNAYGMAVLEALKNKPTLCSGSTMGNQRAIETYLRAMVNEWDETDISMTGADQGFHNYLYYSHKLAGAIDTIVVWGQGTSLVNNLGALRTSSLKEWGIYNETTHQVFNWDGTLSPVAHQWDRDQHLFRYTTQQRMPQMVRQWNLQKVKKQ